MLIKLQIDTQLLLNLFCKWQIEHISVLILTSTDRRMLRVKIYAILNEIP